MTKPLRAALCIAVAAALAGCVSLLPKTTPAQLYSLSIAAPPAPAGDASRAFNVERLANTFPGAAAGSQILTIDGDQAAYIADSRWDSPAALLFDEAETTAFDNAVGPVRLLRAGDTIFAPIGLRLDVVSFEARYLGGPKAPPTVFVSVHALLVGTLDHKVIAEQVFDGQSPATDDRVGNIVDAFDAATRDVLNRIVTWTGQETASARSG